MPDSRAVTPSMTVPPPWRMLGTGACLAGARVLGVLGQMGAQVAVGALAGPAGIGTLQVQMTWGTLLGEVVGGGEPSRSMRDTAVGAQTGALNRVTRNLRRSTAKIMLWSGILVTLIAALHLTGLTRALGISSDILLLSIALAAPLYALTRLLADTLKSLDKPLLAVALENTVIPITLLAACGALALGQADPEHAIPTLLITVVVGTCIATMSLLWGVRRRLNTPIGDPKNPAQLVAAPSAGRRDQVHLWLTGLLNIAFLQLPFLIMPWMVTPEDVGRFAVAHKLVNIITTLLILLSAIYGPRFARAAAARDARRARQQLRETQVVSVLVFAPVWLTLLLLEGPLATLFSLKGGDIATFLLVLGAGQFINAATGLSGVLLNMSGGAHRESAVLTASLILTSAAALALGFTWGATGVAVACAAGIALRNIASHCVALRHLQTLETAKS